MPMTYASINGRVTIPGTDIGIRCRIEAHPLTRDEVITFPANDRWTQGPVVGYSKATDGTIDPAMQIPTAEGATGVSWRFTFTPLDRINGTVLGSWARTYAITASARIEDLVETEPLAVTPELVASIEDMVAAVEADRVAVADHRTDVEAVVATNEGIMTSVLGSGGTFDAALSATYVPDQIDFVELVRAHAARYTTARLVKTAANTYQVRLHDGTKGVVYQLIKGTLDDFIKLDACYTGYGYGVSDFFDPTTAALGGTWNTATSSWYTTVVGATFTGTVSGTRVDLRLIRESRGGLWHVTIDGGAPIPVSCYNTTTTAAILVTLATGLTDTEHTVVATFQGDDPANPPSSSPSRGYVRDDPAGTLVGYVQDAATTTMVLADGSNKEFAFTTYTPPVWIPDHGTASAFQIDAPVFAIDGVTVDVAGAAIGTVWNLTDRFELRQHFHGRRDGVNVLEFHTTHTIDAAGLLDFAGRFVRLAAVQLLGYPLMLPGWDAVTDTFITGLGTEHANTGAEDYTYFAAERDAVFSAALLSSTNANVIAAATLVNPKLTYRRGKPGRPPLDQAMFVWNRATKPKIYWQAFDTHTLAADEGYAWAFKLMVADIDSVRSLATA